MNDEIKKTSKEWQKWYDAENNCETRMIDYDGWDRIDFDYSFKKERITLSEYIKRLSKSTTNIQQKIKWEDDNAT